jgi:hypothetical protein
VVYRLSFLIDIQLYITTLILALNAGNNLCTERGAAAKMLRDGGTTLWVIQRHIDFCSSEKTYGIFF